MIIDENEGIEVKYMAPRYLYHATSCKKARYYQISNCIHGPVRGFDSLISAMLWSMKSKRTVIFKIEVSGLELHLLPDHHNCYGKAWFVNSNVMRDRFIDSVSIHDA